MILKTVRISSDIHDSLLAETEKSGAASLSVLARMIIIERLQKGNWDELREIYEYLPMVGRKEPRIGIRYQERYEGLISEASAKISNSTFGPMVQAILSERYKKLSNTV